MITDLEGLGWNDSMLTVERYSRFQVDFLFDGSIAVRDRDAEIELFIKWLPDLRRWAVEKTTKP